MFVAGCLEERVVEKTITKTIAETVTVTNEVPLPPGNWDPTTVPEQDRMQPDLEGPDGRLYPNFTWAGLPEDVERPEQIFNIQSYSKVGDLRGKYINDALDAAIADAAATGGGIVQINWGEFYLNRPVFIPHDNIVIRGMGRGSRYQTTTLIFNYAPPQSGVDILYPRDGDRMHPEGGVLIAADPGIYEDFFTSGPAGKMLSTDNSRQLTNIGIYLNGQELIKQDKSHPNYYHGAPQCFLRPYVHHLWKAGLKHGDKVTIKATAEWKNGKYDEKTIRVTIDENLPNYSRAYQEYAIFTFAAPGRAPAERFAQNSVIADIARGDTKLTMDKVDGFSVGDYVVVRGSKPDRDAVHPGRYLQERSRIVSIEGNIIELSQPIRLDAPRKSKVTVRRLEPIRNSGVENLTIRQTSNTWIHGIYFHNAWGCWVNEVEIIDIGRNPVVFDAGKQCVISNTLINGGRYPNSGGASNYFGFHDSAQDCLMESVTAVRLRHAPNFQGQTNGCVIRNSTFENSDVQWHAFHPYENLLENCRVFSSPGSGSYGYGAYSSKYDGMHGIAGPRNVIYGNDITGTHKAAIFMGGMTDGWQWHYNKFTSRHIYDGERAAVVLQEQITNTSFYRNHFHLLNGGEGLITMKNPGEGNKFTENVFHGLKSESFYLGDWEVEITDNLFIEDGARAALPWQPVPSLYLWQRASVGL